MKGKLVTLALVLLVLLAPVSCGGQQTATERSGSAENTASSGPKMRETTAASGLQTTTIGLVPSSGAKPVEVRVEVADNDAERERGLMERTSLAEDAGMLFVFEQAQPLSFWMKDTLIPLSIAYTDSGGRIVNIADMKPLDETSHPSGEPAKYALEVNQGFFRDHGVKVGDKIEIPREYR